MLQDRILSMRRANIFEPNGYRHMVCGTRLLSSTGDAHILESNFFVARIMESGTTMLFTTGLYRDTVVEAEGALRHREKIVICDSALVDTLLVIPL
jgi:anthranilate 1,2-dioxygenase small subunit